jgi:hypothetical protein
VPEVELPNPEELHERSEDRFGRRVALVTAVDAVVPAVASLGGNNAMKEMLLAQQLASDQWADYQEAGCVPPVRCSGEARERQACRVCRKSLRLVSTRSAIRLRIISTVPPPIANIRASRTIRSSGSARP